MIRGPRAGYVKSRGWGLTTYTDDEFEEIHDATLEVLRLTGVQVLSEEALDQLERGGCLVDRTNKLVKFPPHVVEEALATAPRQFVLAARDPKHDFFLGGSAVGFTTFGCGILAADLETGEICDSTKADVARSALLCDALPHVDVFSTPVVARDAPDATYPLHMLEASLLNTAKHVQHVDVASGANARRMVQMAAAVAGGTEELRERPILSFLVCPTSPLSISKDCAEISMEGARAGVPVNVFPMGMSGASSPVTLSGMLITHNCETLATLTLCQLVSPGAPVVYGSASTMFDMVCATAPIGAPETGMFGAIVAGLARFYELPSCVVGLGSDTKVIDAQTGHEKTMSGLLPALAGANLVFGMGSIELAFTLSYEQLVIDNEIAAMVKRVLRGSPTHRHALGVDMIHEVGYGGHFLKEKHTREYMATEQSKAGLFDRRNRGAWRKRGGSSVEQRAKDVAAELLRTHEPLPLGQDLENELSRIIAEAERETPAP